jgi:translocation protein SEC62
VWLYEGSQLGLKLAGFGMVALMLAGVMFPLWPPIMRQGVWYLSVGVLGLIGLFIALAIVRLIIYVVLFVAQKPGWLFPNLFEDVGFVESFVPLWAWEEPAQPKKKKAKRVVEGEGNVEAKGKRQAVANLPGVGPGGGAQLNTKKAPEAAATAPASAKAPEQPNGNAPSQHEKLDELN